MQSAEELTLIGGRWLRALVAVLDVVRRIRSLAISSREQRRTDPGRRFGRDSFRPRSES
jgi:hypothetical protein